MLSTKKWQTKGLFLRFSGGKVLFPFRVKKGGETPVYQSKSSARSDKKAYLPICRRATYISPILSLFSSAFFMILFVTCRSDKPYPIKIFFFRMSAPQRKESATDVNFYGCAGKQRQRNLAVRFSERFSCAPPQKTTQRRALRVHRYVQRLYRAPLYFTF